MGTFLFKRNTKYKNVFVYIIEKIDIFIAEIVYINNCGNVNHLVDLIAITFTGLMANLAIKSSSHW